MSGSLHARLPPTACTPALAFSHLKTADLSLATGKPDPEGRLWVGTKALQQQEPYSRTAMVSGPLQPSRAKPPPGRLIAVEQPSTSGGGGGLSAREVREAGPVQVSNGLGWSPDGRTFYYIDSPSKAVVAFDYDRAGGALTNRRLLCDTSAILPGDAVPDGLAVDAQGSVWVAMWGGGAVLRLRPDGTLAAIARIPGASRLLHVPRHT